MLYNEENCEYYLKILLLSNAEQVSFFHQSDWSNSLESMIKHTEIEQEWALTSGLQRCTLLLYLLLQIWGTIVNINQLFYFDTQQQRCHCAGMTSKRHEAALTEKAENVNS
jgi:hypothetical protein